MSKPKMLSLVVVSLFLATLWGCGSNMDSDSSTTPSVELADAGTTGNCTICHTVDVHTQFNILVGKNSNTDVGFGSAIVHDCEACHGGGQYHHGTGPIPYPAPDLARCTTCHAKPIEGVIASTKHTVSGQLSCTACHEPLSAGQRYIAGKVSCSQCHNSPLTYANPFTAEIHSRFETSRHGTQAARNGFCSACHSHEGGVELLAMGRKTKLADLALAYTADTTDAYMLPVGSSTIVGVTKKTCATCHDPHTATLRGDGDVLDADGDVQYSAEFNLCTTCHIVDLTSTLVGHGDAGNLYGYELSDKYTAANLIDASTATFTFLQEAYADKKVAFYHDGASGNGRTFVDTHFGGTIVEHLVKFNGSGADIEIKGYNINAGSKTACTICHDPHTGGKMLSIDSSSTFDYADQLDNKVVSYAEGLGDFHTNYLGAALGHGCLPCHSGDALVPLTLGATLVGNPGGTAPIGCRTCHNLAVPNATPGTNNSATFAAVRTFPTNPPYAFKFNSGAVAAVADLGVNQICFECHKGRTPAKTQAQYAALADPVAGTRNNDIAYLHYAPSMAILFGDESKMATTYAGKTYAGKFVHAGDGLEYGCVDCHDVHNTNGNHAASNKMTNPAFACATCHVGGANDAATLQARTQAFSVRLLETIFDRMADAYALKASDNARYLQYNVGLRTQLELMFDPAVVGSLAGNRTAQDESLIAYIGARNTYFPSKAVAQAAAGAWKVFTYEDGAPHGQTHGHGGSWAHNSVFARQVMYDAILDLGGDVTGLTRP